MKVNLTLNPPQVQTLNQIVAKYQYQSVSDFVASLLADYAIEKRKQHLASIGDGMWAANPATTPTAHNAASVDEIVANAVERSTLKAAADEAQLKQSLERWQALSLTATGVNPITVIDLSDKELLILARLLEDFELRTPTEYILVYVNAYLIEQRLATLSDLTSRMWPNGAPDRGNEQ
ncbi:MAG TPA: hypothetical protein VFU07_05495 [Candidatus Lumbricidophila sp.]|nr:hypothetical protein [Candidatus Lumbricidophila sp.]